MQITLQPREGATLAPGDALRIRCLAGVLWITNQRDSRDRLLAAGDSAELSASQCQYLSSVGRNEPVSFEVSGAGASVRVRAGGIRAGKKAGIIPPGLRGWLVRAGLASVPDRGLAAGWRRSSGFTAWLRRLS
ncbi:DUF2917 domain-containing protein [Pseudoduganella sp. LjRoot289]|uniref:DUF2917 domain-containing protein n=1 Tax=Pseudoduganella sp. LjRoot289 TaxID=3342314 RepID=UPI003ECF85A9